MLMGRVLDSLFAVKQWKLFSDRFFLPMTEQCWVFNPSVVAVSRLFSLEGALIYFLHSDTFPRHNISTAPELHNTVIRAEITHWHYHGAILENIISCSFPRISPRLYSVHSLREHGVLVTVVVCELCQYWYFLFWYCGPKYSFEQTLCPGRIW